MNIFEKIYHFCRGAEIKEPKADKIWKLYEDRKRWTRHSWRAGPGCLDDANMYFSYCLDGAVGLVYSNGNTRGNTPEAIQVRHRLEAELRTMDFKHYGAKSIFAFNDNGVTTADDVYNLCKRLDI